MCPLRTQGRRTRLPWNLRKRLGTLRRGHGDEAHFSGFGGLDRRNRVSDGEIRLAAIRAFIEGAAPLYGTWM